MACNVSVEVATMKGKTRTILVNLISTVADLMQLTSRVFNLADTRPSK